MATGAPPNGQVNHVHQCDHRVAGFCFWAAAGYMTASVLDGAALIMAADYSDSSCEC
jgi:hypothetical protein